MNADRGTEGAEPSASTRDAERVCVVIWDGSAPQSELRRLLGNALPLHFVRWQDRTYLAAIEQLRPSVIVAVEPDDELAADVAGLLACLITTYTPTILGMTLPPGNPGRRRPAGRSLTAIEEESPARAPEATGQTAGQAHEQTPEETSAETILETTSRAPAAETVRLVVRQLGPCEGVRLDSLDDIIFG